MTEPHEIISNDETFTPGIYNEFGLKDGKENYYRIMVYKSKETTYSVISWTFIQQSKKEWTKELDDIRNSEDCIFFEDNIQMKIPYMSDKSVFFMDDYLSHVLNKYITFDIKYFDIKYIDSIIENMRSGIVISKDFERIDEKKKNAINRIVDIISYNMREAIVDKIIDRIIENMREVVHLTE